MAGRNRNTFSKRQRELGRVQKAREAGRDAEKPSPGPGTLIAGIAEGANARDPEARV